MEREPDNPFEGIAASPPARGGSVVRPSIARPMVFVALAFVAGLSVGRVWTIPIWSLWIPAIALAAWTAWDLRPRRRHVEFRREDYHPPRTGYLLFVAVALLGWARSIQVVAIDNAADALAEHFERFDSCDVSGRVSEPVYKKFGRWRVVLQDVKIAAHGNTEEPTPFPLKIELRIPESVVSQRLIQGMSISVMGNFSRPAPVSIPGDQGFETFLKGHGIGAQVWIEKTARVERLPEDDSSSVGFFRLMDTAREKIRSALSAHMEPTQSALAMGLLLGDREGLGAETNDAFMRTGIYHILSVSGLHTAFVLAIALFVARFIWLPPRACAAFGIGLLAGYAILTGLDPPVVRAAIMGAFVLAAWILGRASSPLSALATSAFLTLLYDPRNLLRADWQLSYVCVLSLIRWGFPAYGMILPSDPTLTTLRHNWHSRFRFLSRLVVTYLWLPISVSLAIQLGVLPLQIGIFKQFSIVGILVQPIAVVMTFLIMAGSGLTAMLGWIAPVGDFLGVATGLLIEGFMSFIQWLGQGSWSAIPIQPPHPAWITLYYAILVWGPELGREGAPRIQMTRKQKGMWLARFAVALTVLFFLGRFRYEPARSSNTFDFYVVDVGQGDGLILQFPNGETAVIDGGRRGSTSRPPIVRMLEHLGAQKLAFVVATHADADHIGGLIPILRNYSVGEFICGPDVSESRDYAALKDILERKKIPVRKISAGEYLPELGGVALKALNPEVGLDDNEASVTLLADYREVEILLTGDIERGAESNILRRYFAEDVDVLKVAHHGSDGSSSDDFLDAFTPEIALISVGRNNSYHHPGDHTLARLESRGIQVARTDRDGSLLLRTDGHKMALFHYQDVAR